MKQLKKSLAYILILAVFMTYSLPTAAFGAGQDNADSNQQPLGQQIEDNNLPENSPNGNNTVIDGQKPNLEDQKDNKGENNKEENNNSNNSSLQDPELDEVDPGFSYPIIPDLSQSNSSTTEIIEAEPKMVNYDTLDIKVSNGDKDITDPDFVYDPTLPIKIDASLGLGGEIDVNTIQSGDYTLIPLAVQGFRFAEGSTDVVLEIYDQSYTIGTVSVAVDSDSKLPVIKIIYNDQFSTNTGLDGAYDVEFGFGMTFSLANDPGADEGKEVVIAIGDKNFSFIVPALEKISLEKFGEYNPKTGIITWTLTATTTGEKGLAGYILQDSFPVDTDKSPMVKYLDNSFKTSEGSGGQLDATFNSGNGLAYVFPDTGTVYKEATITFDTKFIAILKHNGQAISALNKAEIYKNADDKNPTKAEYNLKVTPKWLVKGAEYNDTKQQISWTLTVNQEGKGLKNVVITDLLDTNIIEDVSDVYMGLTKIKEQSEANGETPYYSYSSGTLEIFLGDIDAKKTVTFKTKVKFDQIEYKPETVKNTASLKWDETDMGEGGIWPGGSVDSNTAEIKVGYNSIDKSNSGLNRKTGKINWKIIVNNKKQPINISNPVVVDCFVANTDGSEVKSNRDDIIKAINAKLQQQQSGITVKNVSFNLIYDENQNLTNEDIVSYEYKTIDGLTSGGKALTVGILAVKLKPITAEKAEAREFSFDTKAAKYVAGGNIISGYILTNYADLFDGTKYLTSVSSNCFCLTNVILKDLGNVGGGYNYLDRTTEWWIHVNSNQMQLTKPTVIDTLPAYTQVYDKYQNGEQKLFYEVYNGTNQYYQSNGSGSVAMIPQGEALSQEELDNLMTVSNDLETGKVTFQFNQTIDHGYVIKIATQLTEEGALKLFGDGKNNLVKHRNDASLTCDEVDGLASDYEDFNIKNTLLKKEGLWMPEDDENVITWQIVANVNQIDLAAIGKELGEEPTKVYLRDNIPNGLTLVSGGTLYGRVYQVSSVDAAGTPHWSDEDKLNDADTAKYLKFDPAKNQLLLELPDPHKAYVLEFKTTAANTSIGYNNTAELVGNVDISSSESGNVILDNLTASGSAKRAGKITLTKEKTGDSAVKLAGAKFILEKQESVGLDGLAKYAVVDTQTTNQDGQLVFKGLKDGTYRYTEIQAPEGYILNATPSEDIVINTSSSNVEDRIKNYTVTNDKKSNGGGGSSGGGNGNSGGEDPKDPDIIVPDENVPGGDIGDNDGGDNDGNGDEIIIPDENLPAGSLPEGDNTSNLPKTGGLPAGYLYALGVALLGMGLYLRQKVKNLS